MTDGILYIDNFSGGISSGSKRGIAGSFRWGQGLNIHEDPDRLQVMPKSTKDSGSTVVDLPLFGVNNTVNTNKYFLGNAGKLYKRTSAGVYSVLSTYTNAEGMGFFSGTNRIYFVSDDVEYILNPSNDALSTGRSLNAVGYHPVDAFLDKVFIGNGRELVSTDASGIAYDSTTVGGGITIDFNYSIRCLKAITDWLLIGATSDNSTNAKLFIWDGISSRYNYSIPLVGEDGINAINMADDGTVLIHAGKQGHIYQLIGINQPLALIKKLPRIEKDKTIEIYPGTTTNYQGRPLFALSAGTSTTAERGVYSWSSKDKNYPKALNMDFAISTGTTTGITAQIGCLLAVSTTDLFIGWRDGSSYGIDLIDGTGVQGTAIYESLIDDARQSFNEKQYSRFKIKLAADLAPGQVIDIYYKANRGSWTQILDDGESNSLDYAVDGAIDRKDLGVSVVAYELEVKVLCATTGSTSPEIDSLTIPYSFVSDET